MKNISSLCSALLLLALTGCGDQPESAGTSADVMDPQTSTAANVVEFRAVGMTFEGPSTQPAGRTTFRFENSSGMLHFGMLDFPPPGITAAQLDPVMTLFQVAMDAMNAGDQDAANAAFAQFPAWMADLGRRGGPGFLSPGLTGETTVFLEPGFYILECYVKSGGRFHTTSPGPGIYGMIFEIEVTEETTGAVEPEANATVVIRNNGFRHTDGEFIAGRNTIRVVFEEQQAFPSVVGNDLHIMKMESDEHLEAVANWMDWRKPRGLETPAPATFLGGVNDLPAGSTAYVTVDLAPGDYAFIAEVPDPVGTGLVMPFTIE